MTVSELIGYLTYYADHGKGNTPVLVANQDWNAITESEDIVNAVFVEHKSGDSIVVLQT